VGFDCMRRIFCGLAIIAMCVMSAGLPQLAAANDAPNKTVLLFGDSIVAGYGLNATEVVTVKLQEKLSKRGHAFTILNAGVSGDTTAGGRSRLGWVVKRQKPDLVMIALGGNDLLRGVPLALTRENLIAMLEEMKTLHVPVVLSAVQAPLSLGVAYANEFNSMYPALAQRYDVPLYPFLLEPVFGRAGLMQADQIHPNAQGADIIAERLADYLIEHDANPR
jgi:acyl-CoA thioesterase I